MAAARRVAAPLPAACPQILPARQHRAKECPACALEAPADAAECPYCGYEFPVPRPGLRPVTWVMIALMILFAIPLLAWLLG